MINGRLNREMIYHGSKIIIDACRLENGVIEVMALYADGVRQGEEIESATTTDINEAEHLWNNMRWKYEDQEEPELKGKYKELRDNLKKAIECGKAADFGEDGGTCNFDAPAIIAPRWICKKVMQAAKEAGTHAFKWDSYGETKFVFGTPTNAQANRRSRVAYAMLESLKNSGYDTIGYSSID